MTKEEFDRIVNIICWDSETGAESTGKRELLEQLILDLIGEKERDASMCGEITDCNYCASEICELQIRNELRQDLRDIVNGKK